MPFGFQFNCEYDSMIIDLEITGCMYTFRLGTRPRRTFRSLDTL